MLTRPLLRRILDDDALTRGLGDPEARLLVEWLVDRSEALAARVTCEPKIEQEVKRLCRRARALARFVFLCSDNQCGAAFQLAASERFADPLPPATLVDPCEVMQHLLDAESRSAA